MKELQKRLKQFEGHHPVDERLDFYEGLAKSLLKEKESAKLRRVLNMILFVRDNIKKNDAKAAAYFMFKLAVAIQTADLSLRGRKRKGHKKDRRWLDISIEKALQKKPGTSRKMLWNHLRVNYSGLDNALKIKSNNAFGSVYWQNEHLIFYDGDTSDEITVHTFRKAVSRLKMNK